MPANDPLCTGGGLMHVLVLHNATDANASAADLDVLVQVEAISDALRLGGCTLDTLPISLNLDELRSALASIRPDVAFNLVESLSGHDRLAPLAPALLEVLGCPYTGSPTNALFLLCDKVQAKERLRWAGLPTPNWFVSSHGRDSASYSAPARYILKPIHDHASFGIHADSVISASDDEAVHAALAERELKLSRLCFAEQFIDGREFNLSILAGPGGPEVLPPAEILFVDFPADEPRIVHYEAKWEPDSPAYQNTPRRFDFPDSDQSLLVELAELTEACWHLFGLRGYARVDFRVGPDGSPWILEINANPCLSPNAGFAAAVARAGYSFRDAMDRIVADALGEHRRLPTAIRGRPRPVPWRVECESIARP
jgi:D-alanine-D-alanine ligase